MYDDECLLPTDEDYDYFTAQMEIAKFRKSGTFLHQTEKQNRKTNLPSAR